MHSVTFSHYFYIMHENKQKTRQIAFGVLQDFDINGQSREFVKALMVFLELDESKVYQKNLLAEKIAYIHEFCRGQYDVYLTQPKFKQLYPETKDFLWTIFKQYDERLKYVAGQQKPMQSRDHLSPPVGTTNQNMNMNMVNMFMDVPNLQTIEEIQMFQRKMFDIYKNFLPQVLSSMPISSSQPQYYRRDPYQQQYSMGSMNSPSSMPGMTGMAGMAGMTSMSNVQGMVNMSGMTGMTGMPSMQPSMQGMPGNMGGLAMGTMGSMSGIGNTSSIPSMSGNMAGMTSMSFGSKQPQYYDPVTFSAGGRYFFDNKAQSNFAQPMQSGLKNLGTDLRSNPIQGMAFNFCGDRGTGPEDYRNYSKPPTSYSQNKISYYPQQFERKNLSQKFMDDQKYDLGIQSPSPNEFSQQILQKQSSKNAEKEKQRQFYSSSELPLNSEPTKKVKRDEQVSIFNDEGSESQAEHITCTCNEKEEEELCYYCRFINMDPLNEVQKVLKIEKITPDKTNIVCTIDKKILEKVRKSLDRLDIELRCIKLHKDSDGEICWPERYRLLIDEDVIQDYTLQSNAGKKRKDKPCILSKHFGNDRSPQEHMQITLEIKKSEKGQGSTYLLGIFVIAKNTIQKMYEKLMKKMDQQNVSSFFQSESKEKVKESDEEEKIVVSPYEPSIKKLIKDPIRGIFCTHPQCFDLEVYLSFLIISPNRQWKCPICGKEAKDFVIDNEQKAVMADIGKMIKEPKEIVFYADGSHVLKYEDKKQQKKEGGLKNAEQSQ